MANLRIIADDLGLARSVNEGIILALKNNWIDGASLMPNGEAFLHALELAADIPRQKLGVHIVLVEERALSNVANIPTLADSQNRMPKDYQVFFLKYLMGFIRLADIEREARLQIQTCIEHGVRPQFLNSHQHLHLLPGITTIFIKLANEFQIPYIRIVSEPLNGSGSLFRKIEAIVLRMFSQLAMRKIDRAGLKRNDAFIGFVRAGNIQMSDIARARAYAKQYPKKQVELGCHPGFDDPHVSDRYKNWGAYHWKQELEALELTTRT
jgi:predicted glycoside hydrolase/deacetylase ChbG (UPF0249 family)